MLEHNPFLCHYCTTGYGQHSLTETKPQGIGAADHDFITITYRDGVELTYSAGFLHTLYRRNANDDRRFAYEKEQG